MFGVYSTERRAPIAFTFAVPFRPLILHPLSFLVALVGRRFRFRCKFLPWSAVLREVASEWHPLISGTVARSRFSIADSRSRATTDGDVYVLRVSACSLAACC